MKKLIPALTLVLLAIQSFSQAGVLIEPFPKTIKVAGSSEIEIIPDEIYVVVDLKEYEKKGIGKIELEKIKSEFINTCHSIGLADSSITIASYEGYNNYPWWRKKKRKDELYASIAYQIKFNSSKKIDELVEKLDEDATNNFRIIRTSHSKIQEYRKQLKIQAIRSAKEKAIYLSNAIDEKIGEAITITEVDDHYTYYLNTEKDESHMKLANRAEGFFRQQTGNEEPGLDFKKIKLRLDMVVVFALK